MQDYSKTAIVFGDLKAALLYFEYVIPMNVTGAFMGLRPESQRGIEAVEQFAEPSMDGRNELLATFGEGDDFLRFCPPELRSRSSLKSALSTFDSLFFAYLIWKRYGDEKFHEYIANLRVATHADGPLPDHVPPPSQDVLGKLFGMIARDFGLSGIPVDCSGLSLGTGATSVATHALNVGQIRVIDTDKMTVPQIMSLREDPNFMKKMRAFRLFAYEQYKEKEPAFIQDDIQKRLDDYTDAVKASGFETKLAGLSFLFDSGTLKGAFATSAAALLLGRPEIAIGAFGLGTVVEIGKLSLHYAQHKNDLQQICREHPVSYLDELRKKTSSS